MKLYYNENENRLRMLLLSLFLIVAASALPASATNVNIGNFDIPAGSSVNGTLMVNGVTDFYGVIVTISYDPSVVIISNVEKTKKTDSNINISSNFSDISNSIGQTRILADGNYTGLTGDIVLANITFKAVGTVGSSSTLNITVNDMININSNDIIATPINGKFNIIGTFPIVSSPSSNQSALPTDTDNTPLWGEIARLNVTVIDNSGVAGVTVNLSEIGGLAAKPMTNIDGNIWSTTTNASAGTPPKIYNLTVNATNTLGYSNTSVTIPLRVMKNGDCNGNGAVNSGDATRVYMNTSYPGNPLYPLSSRYVCDVTGNGAVNSGDATRIYMNTSYPGNPLYLLK